MLLLFLLHFFYFICLNDVKQRCVLRLLFFSATFLWRAQGILERLDAGEVVIGDGGFVFALEKRGYVKAGPWTPEAAAEYPEAGKLHGSVFFILFFLSLLVF